MAIELVKAYLKTFHREQDIIELLELSATVELAAQALHTQPERIAKSLAFMVNDHAVLIVCAGDVKVDNHAFKEYFKVKAKMLKGDEVEAYTNHTIGGVCPFALPSETQVYLDESMKRFDFIYPACGSSNSAIKCTMQDLQEFIPHAIWVNICKEVN